MLVAVAVAAWLPITGSRRFYLAGDSIASWLPVSRRIGELLRNGDSPLMDPTLWRGGNFVAEAGYGLWNPIVVLLDLTVLQIDDLELAATIVKAVFMLVLAAGVFGLAREYGAAPWPAAVAGLAVPVGGFTLWMDAATWTPNLISFAFTPYVWIAARRVAREVGNPIWLVVSGALCVTAGNPYSNVVVFVIVVAVAVEVADRRRRRPLIGLAGALVAIGLIALFVYIPFRQTSAVGFRRSGIFNDEILAPGLGDLLGISTPTSTPFVRIFGTPALQFPGTYLAWFILPLVPWLRWRTLTSDWRRVTALAVFGAAFLVLVLGPSHFWFFRWPVRLVPYLYLPVMIATARVVSAGLNVTEPRRRAVISIALIAAPAYLAWSDVPEDIGWHAAGSALVVAGTGGAAFVASRRPRAVGPALMIATVIVLVFQLQWRPTNPSVRDYNIPPSAAELDRNFRDRYRGDVVQVGAFDAIPPDQRRPDGAYRDLMVGSVFAIPDVDTVSAYSGIGFTTHDAALCLRFDGSTCAGAWDRLWRVPSGGGRLLADLLRIETVIAQRTLVDTVDAPPPEGWSQAEVTDHVVVWNRDEDVEWPDGRLTDVAGSAVVVAAVSDGPHRETVDVERSGSGDVVLTFARLAWPGYEASLNGEPLLVGGGPAGLLTVTIPDGADAGRVIVTWTPPFWRPSQLALVLGLALGILVSLWWWRTGRRRSAGGADAGPAVAPDEPIDDEPIDDEPAAPEMPGAGESADESATPATMDR
jgi:hypothetical protein